MKAAAMRRRVVPMKIAATQVWGKKRGHLDMNKGAGRKIAMYLRNLITYLLPDNVRAAKN